MADGNPEDINAIRGLVEDLLRMRVGQILEPVFKANPKFRTLFDLTGRATRDQIRKRTGLSPNLIASTWADWLNRGVIRKAGQGYEKLWRESE